MSSNCVKNGILWNKFKQNGRKHKQKSLEGNETLWQLQKLVQLPTAQRKKGKTER